MADEYLSIQTDSGEALILRESLPEIGRVDGVIFDVDGVIIDSSSSIRRVHAIAAERYFTSLGWRNCGRLVDPEEVDAFKFSGGFNSDWDISYIWQLTYLFKSRKYNCTDGKKLRDAFPTLMDINEMLSNRSSGVDSAIEVIRELSGPDEWEGLQSVWHREAIRRLFLRLYSGELCHDMYGFEPDPNAGQGFIYQDGIFLDSANLPRQLKLGIATGRTAGEAIIGLKLAGLYDFFDPQNIVTEDDGFKKPDPGILVLIEERIRAEHPIYIGDTPDDLLTVDKYNALGRKKMLSCMVLTGLKNPAVKERFILGQADIVADNVNAALMAIALAE